MKILVGIPTAGYLRNASLLEAVGGLRRPDGTINAFIHGQSPARARNHIFELAIKHDCSHVMLIDDDTYPPQDIIEKLLRHDKDVVTGVLLKRDYPHHPILFSRCTDDGRCEVRFLHELPGEGLIEIKNCGLGCVLIKTDVLRAMLPLIDHPTDGRPPIWVTLGESEKDHWGDDTVFFNKVTAAGFKIYCDLEVRVGHMGQVIVTPEFVDGQWLTSLNLGGNEGQIKFGTVRPANAISR